MTRWLIISILIFPFCFHPSYSQPNHQDQDLLEIISERGQAEVIIGYPGQKAFDLLTRNVSISKVIGGRVHIILSRITAAWFTNQQYRYEIKVPEEHKGRTSARNKAEAMEWNTYPTWQQYDSIMNYYADSFPGLCRLDTIGTSINGRIVYALKISDNAAEDEEDEPDVFFSSTIHGDETGGFVLMLRLADYLLTGYSAGGTIRNLMDNRQIWINPLANPDGTYNISDTITSPVRFNANGYDLNRNFPDPAGVNPPRQKETLDMMKFLSKHRFVLSANFHSGAEVVNYPWDRWQRYHADNSWFYDISEAYADTVHNYSEADYMTMFNNGITNGYEWYQIYGGRQDYIVYELQGREVTIELDRDYVTPPGRLDDLWEYNREALTGYLENALYGIHGKVTDSRSGDPVPARIFIEGHDGDSSHIYSDTLSGRFIRLIGSGSWSLTFSADGYRDTVVTGVVAGSRQRYDLMVQMERIPDPVDTTTHSLPLLYPNPAASCINAVIPEDLRGNLNIAIYDIAGVRIRDYDIEANDGSPVIIDITAMPPGIYLVRFRNRVTGFISTGRFVVAVRH